MKEQGIVPTYLLFNTIICALLSHNRLNNAYTTFLELKASFCLSFLLICEVHTCVCSFSCGDKSWCTVQLCMTGIRTIIVTPRYGTIHPSILRSGKYGGCERGIGIDEANGPSTFSSNFLLYLPFIFKSFVVEILHSKTSHFLVICDWHSPHLSCDLGVDCHKVTHLVNHMRATLVCERWM